MNFITQNKKTLTTISAIAFWIAVWFVASEIIGEELFLSSPISVLKAFLNLLTQKTFYVALLNSSLKITIGFLSALVFGSLLSILAKNLWFVKILLSPIMSVIKSTPVASFTILAIILFGTQNLSIIISFLMVVPIIYQNVLTGLENTSTQLLEMAKIFEFSRSSRFRYVIAPSVMPYLFSACSVCLGLSWKSGVAAEVIGISSNTIGGKLYDSKIYLNIPELFAYTAVIVVVSMMFERIFLKLLKKSEARVMAYETNNRD